MQRMTIEYFRDYETLSLRAAEILALEISEKPDGVFGFATGSTPLRLYELLVERYQRKEITFSRLTTVNLDEYIGLPPDHEQCYANFMHRHLFGHVDVRPGSIHFPEPGNPAKFDKMIQDKGGLDLQILGLGANGHIGFNEPGSEFDSRTRVVELAPSTMQDNARFFHHTEELPHRAVTMGMQTILEAHKILLLASGKGKAPAVAHCLEGPVNLNFPGSCLQIHRHVTVLLDESAASKLKSSRP